MAMIYSNVVDNPAVENTVSRNERPMINVAPVIYNMLSINILLHFILYKYCIINIFQRQWLLIGKKIRFDKKWDKYHLV